MPAIVSDSSRQGKLESNDENNSSHHDSPVGDIRACERAAKEGAGQPAGGNGGNDWRESCQHQVKFAVRERAEDFWRARSLRAGVAGGGQCGHQLTHRGGADHWQIERAEG